MPFSVSFTSLFTHTCLNSRTLHCWTIAKVNARPGEEKNFYRQLSIVKYSSLPRDTFKTYVEMHVTCRKLTFKVLGYCRQ